MAPIVKGAENSGEPPSSTTTGPSAPKAAAEGSTRTQPVALEIPVTVNGARTAEGSDKREPFSESTKTVLIFNQGAVIRIATPVAPGQLLFLTNEKSKKEVVCQVVKSKSGGGPGAGYVELQFTEPAAAFWGMRFPAVPNTPVAPASATLGRSRAAASAASTTNSMPTAPSTATPAPKTIAPAAAAVTKPAAPVLPAPLPPKPSVVPPPPAAAKPEPPKPVVPVATAPAPAPLSFVPPPAPLPPVAPPAPAPKGEPGIPEIHDYSKEIAAIFAVPPVGSPQPAPVSSAPSAPPAASQPSTRELQLEATRLQEQLGSPRFPETPRAALASSAAPAPASSSKPPAPADTTRKLSDTAHHEAKPAAKPLPKAVPPGPKSKSYDIEQVEEVKVPDWLAPLSRNTEPSTAPASAASDQQPRIPAWLAPLSHIAEPAAIPSASSTTTPAQVPNISASAEELPASEPWPAGEAEVGLNNTAFGEAALNEPLESEAETSTSGGSKKGLFVGLAAATLLFIGGGVWYMRQSHVSHAGSSPAKAVQAPPASNQTVAVNTLPAAKPDGAPLAVKSNPASAPLSPATVPPSKNTPANALPVAPAPSAPPRSTTTVAPQSQPAVEQPKRASLGAVRLATPVVNRGADSLPVAEADPSLTTAVPTPGAESLSTLSSAHRQEPAAPLPVGGDVKAARLVKSVPPIYPQMARTQHVSGNVSIDAVVDVNGNVTAMKVLAGPTILHHAALGAVQQWHYEPAILDGKPTASHLTIVVQFRLQ